MKYSYTTVYFSVFSDVCRPGTFIQDSKCEDCPQDQYNAGVDQTKCTACPQGTGTLSKGAKSDTECKGKWEVIHNIACGYWLI